ncbi:hypothetical protein TREMEDRAFT_66269 [Tremella mesenterica DSM 1558]|uniref:uncharacterized protein n=1 Tax=Tremella mesenterica (strain ATCC 24925 / CBS 8224 / DSM 1558 / NBRC 9311 / NRRL Y-6157 / RJB 2259-6 / UBC 559-6) TaxID=578456 RepID=UPI00032CD3E4|nr:uncharacterized protein TREMEDRAFT_66269 [Tremella mesenterica DSM 1558]EIW65676.1 hypothetical protein TREMEDRAFT_66269 [Tremella mesenterica DSM 1558]
MTDPRIANAQRIIEQGILADTHDACDDCLAALQYDGTIREAQPCYYMLDGVLGKCARRTRHGRACYMHDHDVKTDGLRTRPAKNIFAVYRSDEELAIARSRLEAYNVQHPKNSTSSIVPSTVATPTIITPTIATIATISMVEDLRIACRKLAEVCEIITNSENVPLSFAARLADLESKLEPYAYDDSRITTHIPVESHVNQSHIHFDDFNIDYDYDYDYDYGA